MNELQPLRVSVINNLDAFHALASEWRALHDGSDANSPFLTWEWLYHWTITYLSDDRLWILLFMDSDDRLRGIAPFCVRQKRYGPWATYREVAFLGGRGVGSVYLDVIAARGDKPSVLACLCNYLFLEASTEWDIVTLAPVPSESVTVDLLQEQFDIAGKVASIIGHTCCPTMDLPPPLKPTGEPCAPVSSARFNANVAISTNKARSPTGGPAVTTTFLRHWTRSAHCTKSAGRRVHAKEGPFETVDFARSTQRLHHCFTREAGSTSPSYASTEVR